MQRTTTVAAANWKALIWVLLLGVGVIGVMSWYPVFAQGYDVKNSMKLACNDIIKIKRFGAPGDNQNAWRDPFVHRATQAGVNLKEKQYSFSATHDRQAGEWVCKARVTYPTTMEWALVGSVLAIEPMVGKKDIIVDHRVRDSY